MAHIDRRTFLTCAGAVAGTLPLTALVPQAGSRRARRIGFLIGNEQSLIDAFTNALKGLGYADERDLVVETRIASGPDTAKYATELAASDLELVVAAALPQALEIRRANPAPRSGPSVRGGDCRRVAAARWPPRRRRPSGQARTS